MIPGYSILGKDAIAGAGAVNGNASGALLVINASIIPGAVSAGAAAIGATLPIAVSVKPGYAAVGYSTESMIPGDAGPGRLALGQISHNADGHASGALLTVGTSLIEGAASSGATANGATLVVNESLIAGSASAGALALGSTLSVTTSLKPGYVAVGLSSPSMIPGDEGPGRFALGQLSEGSGVTNGNATGAIITVQTSILPGVAAVSDEAPAVERGMPPAYRPRRSVDGFAQGALITIGVSVIAGHAEGEHTIIVREADGGTRTIVIVGATHEELSNDEFIFAAIDDELDLWLMNKRQLEDA